MTETLCKDCGKQPIVPSHDRCQACLVQLTTKRPGQSGRVAG